MSEQKTLEILKSDESSEIARRITRIDDTQVARGRPSRRRGSERFVCGGG